MKMYRTVAISVLAVWLAVVGWHVQREYFRPEAERLAAGARMLAPGAHWYVIRMDGVAIGLAQSRLDTLPEGYVFNDDITLDVPALGEIHRSRATTRIDLGPSLDLRAFRFALDSEIGKFDVRGEVQPDSTVALIMNAGGGEQRSSMRVSGSMLLDAAMTLRMAASNALRVGNEFTARVFDPSSLSERDVLVSVTARDTIIVSDSARLNNGRWEATLLDSVPVWRVEQKYGGVTIADWVDDDGQIVRADSPLGFTIERMYYELARQEWQAGRGSNLAA